MTPRSLEELAEQMRITGDADMARELFQTLDDLEALDGLLDLKGSLEDYNNRFELGSNDPSKQLERMGDKCDMLETIREELEDYDRKQDPDDEVKAMLAELADIREALELRELIAEGGNLLEALSAALERVPKYDL